MTAPSNPFSDPAWLRVYATISLAVLRATNAPGADPDLASMVESERIAKAVYDELRKRYPAFPAEAIASALPADSCTCPPPSGPRTMPGPPRPWAQAAAAARTRLHLRRLRTHLPATRGGDLSGQGSDHPRSTVRWSQVRAM